MRSSVPQQRDRSRARGSIASDEAKLKYAEQEVLSLLKNFGDPATDELHKTVLLRENVRNEQLNSTFSKLGVVFTKIRQCDEDRVRARVWGPTNIKCFTRRLKDVESELARTKENLTKELGRLSEDQAELESSLGNLDELLKEASPVPISPQLTPKLTTSARMKPKKKKSNVQG